MTALYDADRVHLTWETALDRLELEVIIAERLLADPAAAHHLPSPEPWDEPRLDGPMPADLMDRALALRERQRRVEIELGRALGAVHRQHRFAARVDRATGRRSNLPIYVDVDA